MQVLIIDGQGGGIGKTLVEQIKAAKLNITLMGVGTNAVATSALIKAGADACATGENAVIFNAGQADIIMGPLGLLSANALMGEVTPAMAAAISASSAVKLLLPTQRCNIRISGYRSRPLAVQVKETVEDLRTLVEA
jgi:hypothetical protein